MVGVIPVTVGYSLGMIHLGIVFWTQSEYQGAHLLWVVLSEITSKNDCAFQDSGKCGWLGSEQVTLKKRVTALGGERII